MLVGGGLRRHGKVWRDGTRWHPGRASPPLHPHILSVPQPPPPPPLPRREVFDDADGEIKRLEGAAAADPSHKIDLIRHLQVRGQLGRACGTQGWETVR